MTSPRKVLVGIAVSICLTACGQSISGTYQDQLGMVTFTFESGGKLYAKTMGVTQELKYEVDGKKIKIALPDGANVLLTVAEDGSLDGWLSGKLTKKK